ncbi:MAG: DnaT-like ssDNA-binding domain-containing protein [Porticoccaceae bacterium]
MRLIPEKPLVFSPQLAATLGLEEAILLQILDDIMACHQPEERNGFRWLDIDAGLLSRLAPFWSLADLQRIAANLRDKGVLLIGSAPLTSSQCLRYAFNEGGQRNPPERRQPSAPPSRGANLISQRWQPEDDVLAQLAQYGIAADFALAQVGEFVTYWSERNEPRHSWGGRFLKQVLRLWREQESEQARRGQEIPMAPDWRPSADAMEILCQQAGINYNFVEDAIPEFVLYWRERGNSSSTWNSQFIQHVRRQWARYTSAVERDSEPRPMSADWQPGETLYEVLALANIERDFATELVPEFVLYWRESGQISNTWNTKFLQYVKRQWAYHCDGARNHLATTAHGGAPQRSQHAGSTRHRNLADELNDRSWAN